MSSSTPPSDPPSHAPPGAGGPDPASAGDGRRGRRRLLLIAALAAAILAALLLCLWADPPRPFDYFRAKAAELDHDPERVRAWVADDVATLPYRGDVKGPLGALWEGAGSPEEKRALARAVLAHCPGGGDVTLDDVAPERDLAGVADAPVHGLSVVHRALRADGEPVETGVWSGPIGDLVGDVHSVRVPRAGRTVVEVRGDPPRLEEVDTEGAAGEELVFRIERPGAEPLEVVRELWRAGNRVGLDSAAAGDLHAFVVWPCRIGDDVREREELRLEESGRREAAVGVHYLRLLDYARRADAILGATESAYGVRARFDLPRILFSSEIEHDGRTAQALDLRQNAVAFTGDRTAAWQAANARSWQEAALEHRFLEEALGVPARTAWGLFQRLQETRPDEPGRRLRLASAALARLVERPGWEGVTLAVAGGGGPRVRASRADDGGVRLEGGPVTAEVAARLGEALELSFDADGRLAATFAGDALGEAAVAVEATLLGAAGEAPTPPDYALAVTVDRAPALVAPGAAFRFGGPPGEGGGRARHEVVVTPADGGVTLDYVVRDGLHVVRGRRTVSAGALAGATRHNPHYGRGESEQADATSFCVSRAVADRLRAGEPAPFALLAARELVVGEEGGERAVAWEGDLVPRGEAELTCRVNGVEATLPALRASAGEREVVLLDDPAFPVGLADRLVAIETAIPARLVDAEGLAWVGVTVAVGDAELETDVDGAFTIPAGAPGVDDRSRARCVVRRTAPTPAGPEERVLGEVEVDLSAPGLDGITVALPRPEVDVRLIEPAEADALEALAVSGQVKRHARRYLDAGRTVAIPARMVDTGFGEAVGFFAHDPATGDLVGVTEDGLHGSSSSWAALRNEIQQELLDRVWEAREDLQKDGIHPIHMIRGFVVAFGVYATHRLKGLEHDEVVRRMLDEMEAWEAQTNLFTHVPGAIADTEAGGLVSKVGNANGKVSFYVGYLSALAFLHEELGR